MGADLRREPLRTLIDQHPGWVLIFEEFGITVTGETDVTLRAAADRANVDVEMVVAAMAGATVEWTCDSVHRAPLRALIAHLVERHHRFLRDEFPRIERAIANARVTAPTDPSLTALQSAFTALLIETERHLQTEETSLFPLCRDIIDAFSWPSFHTGPIASPIRELRHDHERTEQLLAVVADLCEHDERFRPLISALEADLDQHLHEEADLLFPAILHLAADLYESTDPGFSTG